MTNERLIKIVTNILLYGKEWKRSNGYYGGGISRKWGDCYLNFPPYCKFKENAIISVWLGTKFNRRWGCWSWGLNSDIDLSNRNDPNVTLLMFLLKDIFPDI